MLSVRNQATEIMTESIAITYDGEIDINQQLKQVYYVLIWRDASEL